MGYLSLRFYGGEEGGLGQMSDPVGYNSKCGSVRQAPE